MNQKEIILTSTRKMLTDLSYIVAVVEVLRSRRNFKFTKTNLDFFRSNMYECMQILELITEDSNVDFDDIDVIINDAKEMFEHCSNEELIIIANSTIKVWY